MGWLEPSGVPEAVAVDETELSEREKMNTLSAKEVPEEKGAMRRSSGEGSSDELRYRVEDLRRPEMGTLRNDTQDFGGGTEDKGDDPASKLARDLQQAVVMRHRNRIFSGVAIVCSALLLLGVYFFLWGDEEKTSRGPSAPPVRTDEVPVDTTLPKGAETDPFREMIDADLARETRTGEKSIPMKPTPPKPSSAQGDGYRIQAGAFLVASNAENFAEKLRGKGFELAQGYGALKDSTFRVGNMGWIPEEYIDEMLAALAQVVS